ncbi:MAG: acetyl-CoA carboxylase carboxyltransferase subunit beta, partial [Gemmatimonadaceae bacterium]
LLAVQSFDFMGGSLGLATAEALLNAMRTAVAEKLPFVLIVSSGGARMQEGVLSLMQMAKTSALLAQVAERRIPYVSILTNPTTGGVSASFAMLGDAILAEPGAVIGFAGPRVIKQTIGQDLPEGFQTAEFLLEHGMLDSVVHRKDLKGTVGQLLRHMSGEPSASGWTSA